MAFKFLNKKTSPVNGAWNEMSRKELLAGIAKLQADNLALHSELTIQHEKANVAVRIIRDLYIFVFRLLRQYVEVAQHYREENMAKPVPALWLAARISEEFMDIFDKHPVAHYQLGPDKNYLKNVLDISRVKVNPGSSISLYLAMEESNVNEASAESKEQGQEPEASAS